MKIVYLLKLLDPDIKKVSEGMLYPGIRAINVMLLSASHQHASLMGTE